MGVLGIEVKIKCCAKIWSAISSLKILGLIIRDKPASQRRCGLGKEGVCEQNSKEECLHEIHISHQEKKSRFKIFRNATMFASMPNLPYCGKVWQLLLADKRPYAIGEQNMINPRSLCRLLVMSMLEPPLRLLLPCCGGFLMWR